MFFNVFVKNPLSIRVPKHNNPNAILLAHPTKSVAEPNQTPTIFNGLSFKFATFATWNIKQT